MPNWKIHLELGNRLLDKLNYNEKDKKVFLLGAILPDINNAYAVKTISKKISHVSTHYKTIDSVPTYLTFYKRYKPLMKEPIVFGYFIHLYMDYTWNDNFYRDSIELQKIGLSHDELRKLKQSDFRVYNNKYINNCIENIDYEYAANKTKLLDRVLLNEYEIADVVCFLRKQLKYDGKYQFYNEEKLDELMEKTVVNLEKVIDNNFKL